MDSKKVLDFLAFPPELRNRIYEYALNDSGNIYLLDCKEDGPWFPRRKRTYERNGETMPHSQLAPNLLATCKQIHAEAVKYLYDQEIAFERSCALRTFLSLIRPRNRERITRVRVNHWGFGPDRPELSLLAIATNLKAIRIDYIYTGGREAGRRRLLPNMSGPSSGRSSRPTRRSMAVRMLPWTYPSVFLKLQEIVLVGMGMWRLS